MISALRRAYGDPLATFDGYAFHVFPTLPQLAAAREADLRALGFGYRAPYVCVFVHLVALGKCRWC